VNAPSVEPCRTARPPIKCVGGKSKLVPELLKRLPKTFNAYYEPFVGGGALFFALQSKLQSTTKTFLADLNPYLIDVYCQIRDDVESLIRELKKDHYLNNKEAYLDIREVMFNGNRLSNAAQFIYTNKTGFNGLFRVNKQGHFNVPFGRYDNPTICDEANLRACSRALRNTHIYHRDFVEAVFNARKGDVVYFDPPYWPASKTANFTSYTSDGFGSDDQIRLRDVAKALKKNGVFVLLSNADVPQVRELYKKDFTIDRVEMRRSVNSKGDGRGKVGELLIY
jgi:DNA adenine methylase